MIKTSKIKIFFIPYAGASSLAYLKWSKYFNQHFEPCFIELAGRGVRSQEDFYLNMDDASADLAQKIKESVGDDDYFIYGHSMGALLAFEVYYKLMDQNVHPPLHIFFSGKDAPHLPFKRDQIYEYSDDKFLNLVSLYGALPVQIFDEELKKIFIPILKADFKILCQYQYLEKDEKINCDISILYSDRDFSIKHSEINKWYYHAGQECFMHQFSGDHFFINQQYQEVVEIMNHFVEKYAR